jgi:energy-coupling factor transporter ATP-binding protein EcfA2
MTHECNFPIELLDQSPENRLNFFKNPNGAIMHRKLQKAFDRLYRLILKPAGASFTLVMGPSGVGKSTLLDLIQRKIIENSLTQMEKDPGWYPIICMEAPARKGGLKWRGFYKELLVAADEPCIDQKITYDEDGVRRGNDDKLLISSRATEDSLRMAARKVCKHRKPYTIAIDEFEHFGISANEEDIKEHMHVAKSFVNQTKVPWTVFGTYELLDFIELNDQLSRRDRIVHLERYRLEVDEDMKEFNKLVEYLLQRMPFRKTPKSTRKLLEFCYEGSIGNFGTLFDWFTEAYDLSLSEDSDTLAFAHLEETISLESEREKMLEEAQKGESRLTRNSKKRKLFRKKLGFDKKQDQSSQQQSAKNSNQQEENSSKTKNQTSKPENPENSDQQNKNSSNKKTQSKAKSTEPKKKRGKPFERNPKRDPVKKASA